MNLSEFKAWFEGFTEDMDGPPNAKQWKRIKARVKEIDGTAITYPVFIDRWRPYWPSDPFYSSTSSADGIAPQQVTNTMLADAGRAEFKSITGEGYGG